MAKFGMHKVVFTLVIDPSEDGGPNDMTLWTFLYSIIHSVVLRYFLLHLSIRGAVFLSIFLLFYVK